MNETTLEADGDGAVAIHPDFVGFPKMARLSRHVIVTEKIDGTNAQVHITDAGLIYAGSRNGWITPAKDNFGFAKWVESNKTELLRLGPGTHFGEWWGSGIQRTYGLKGGDKRFSLFNVARWADGDGEHEPRPACCGVVPILWRGLFTDLDVRQVLGDLERRGSSAAPGFMQPEGIVVFHVTGNVGFKKTIEGDESPKGIRQ